MKPNLEKEIKILKKAQKESVIEQQLHLEELQNALFEVFKYGTEKQFSKLSSGIVCSGTLLYKIGHWKCKK